MGQGLKTCLLPLWPAHSIVFFLSTETKTPNSYFTRDYWNHNAGLFFFFSFFQVCTLDFYICAKTNMLSVLLPVPTYPCFKGVITIAFLSDMWFVYRLFQTKPFSVFKLVCAIYLESSSCLKDFMKFILLR